MMGGVFRDVVIAWEGVDYTFTPSMRTIRTIEGGGVSVMQVLSDLGEGKVHLASLSYIAAALLKSAGARTSDEKIYTAMLTGEPELIGYYSMKIAECMMPRGPEEKKPVARATTKPRARATTPRKPKALRTA
jgi:hypothetical protein